MPAQSGFSFVSGVKMLVKKSRFFVFPDGRKTQPICVLFLDPPPDLGFSCRIIFSTAGGSQFSQIGDAKVKMSYLLGISHVRTKENRRGNK